MFELTMHSAAGMAETQDLAIESTVERLVRDHARMVFRICYAVSRNHHDAEDASQEVFFRVLNNEKKLARVSDEKAWLARIAWRVAIDRLPRRASISISDEQISQAIAQLRDSGASAEETASRAEMKDLLARVVMGLPDELRAPLLLGGLQELNSREIAGLLNVPESTVRVRQMRARKLMKEKLSWQIGGGR